jgi:hypothetical protein
MTIPTGPRTGRRIVIRVLPIAVVVVGDVVVAVVALGRAGDASGDDRAAFTLLGAGAAAGAGILLVALLATVAGRWRGGGRRAASAALMLAWLRLLAVVAVAIGLGVFVSGHGDLTIIVFLDAVVTLAIAATTRRLT